MSAVPRLQPWMPGRAEEADRLTELLMGEPNAATTVVIEGETGAGKSALVRAVLARVQDRPGAPGLSRVVAEPRRGSEAAEFALVEQWGGEMPPVGGVTTATRLLLAAWRDGPRAHEFTEPHTVVLVEDAHHLLAQELEAVQAALLRFPTRITLVLLARPRSGLDPVDARRIVLGGLTREETGRLIRDRVPHARERAIIAVHELTRGNPGDVTDLLWEAPAHLWWSPRPRFGATVRHREELDRRLAGVSPAAEAAAAVLAVLATPTSYGRAVALAASLDHTLGDDLAAAGELVARGLVEISGPGGALRLTWTHPMFTAAMRDRLGPGEVLRLHAAAARQAETEAQRLHHRVAGAVRPDADLAAQVAGHARRRAADGALAEAARGFLSAQALATSERNRAEYLVEAVDAFTGAGRLADAEDLLPELEAVPRTGHVAAAMGYLAVLRGRQQEAETYLAEASALGSVDPGSEHAADSSRTSLPAVVAARQTLHALADADAEGILTWSARAVEAAPKSAPAVEAAAIRGLGLGGAGREAEARALYRDLARQGLSGAQAQAQRVGMGHGWLEAVCDDPLTARALLERAVPTEVGRGSTRVSLWAQAWLARTYVQLGEWDAALTVSLRAGRVATESGHEIVRPMAYWPAAHVLALRGEVAAAHEALRAGAAPVHGYPIMRIPAASARAQVAEVEADYEAAIDAIAPIARDNRDPEGDTGFWPWPSLYANALALSGRVDEAEAFLLPHLAVARSRGRASAVARSETVLGRILAARGDVEGSAEAFERAMASVRSLPLPLDHARVRFAFGQTMRRLGKRREASRAMRAAREGFVTLGADAYVARCDRELKSGVPEARGGVAELTPQERSVVELVASGMTNKEVASELYVSVKTVQYHLTRIYAKLGVRSRSELAARYGGGERSE